MSEPMDLPHFKKALKPYAGEFPSGTFWRYMNGLLPTFVQWLVEHIDVLEALLLDARAHAHKGGNDTTLDVVTSNGRA